LLANLIVSGFKNNQDWVDFLSFNMVYLYGTGGDERASPGAKSGGAKPRVQNKFKLRVPVLIGQPGCRTSHYESAVRFFIFRRKGMKNKKLKKTQSIIEYICVAVMFAAIGVAAYFATNGTNFSGYQNKVANQMLDTE
jgi:hypothetical protein